MNKLPPTAFLGTGLMGAPMAARLQDAGLLRAAWNRSVARTAELAAAGVVIAVSAAAAVRGAEILCLCLTDSESVREVLFGEQGIVGLLEEGPAPLIVDFTTSSPEATQRLAQRYRSAAGGAWLDAPVSGGVQRARAGSLIAFCGGEEGDFADARPVLDAVASRATRVGPVGCGQAAKLTAQLIAAPTLVAIAEALAAAEALGLDSTQLVDLFAGGLVDSPLLQIFGRRMAARQSQPKIGAVGTMLKDIDAAVRMAGSAASPVPVACAAADTLRAVCHDGGSSQELTALIEYYVRGQARRG